VHQPIANTRQSNGTVQVSPRGEIDLDSAYLIREVIDQALTDGGAREIAIDLAQVTSIDSLGIETLVACFHVSAASAVRLRLHNPSAVVFRQLWVAGLAGLFGLLSRPPVSEQRTPAVVTG
jgi:anti-anti-sigma factor